MHTGTRFHRRLLTASLACTLATALAACASFGRVTPEQARAVAGDYTFSGGVWAAGIEGQLTLDSAGTASMTVFTRTSTAQVPTPTSCYLQRLDVVDNRLWLRCGRLEMRVALTPNALAPEAEIRVEVPVVRSLSSGPLDCSTSEANAPRCLPMNVPTAATGTRQYQGHVAVQRADVVAAR